MADFESVQQKISSFTPIMLPTILLTSTENLGDVRSQSALLRDEQRADRRRGRISTVVFHNAGCIVLVDHARGKQEVNIKARTAQGMVMRSLRWDTIARFKKKFSPFQFEI